MSFPSMEAARSTGHHRMMIRVFANGLGDQGSIPCRVIPKTLKKNVLDTFLLNTQHYKRYRSRVK